MNSLYVHGDFFSNLLFCGCYTFWNVVQLIFQWQCEQNVSTVANSGFNYSSESREAVVLMAVSHGSH